MKKICLLIEKIRIYYLLIKTKGIMLNEKIRSFCLKIKDRLPMLHFAILVIALSSSFYLSNEIEENKIETSKSTQY